ncbi:MAG: MlaD family protein [Gemmatimonadota bacterium]
MDDSTGRNAPTWTDVIPGLLILGALLVVSLVTFFGDAIRRATAEGPRITVLSPDVSGLEKGSVVWIAGKPSGRVLDVQFREPGGMRGERVAIEAILLREAVPFLRADARVTIGSASLLAPSVVKIGAGSAHASPVADGDTLRVASELDMEAFRTLADSVRTTIADAAEGASRLRRLLTDGDGSAARFIADPGFLTRLDSTGTRMQRLTRAWRDGGGLSRLAREDSVHASAIRALRTLRDLAGAENRPVAMDSLAHAMQSMQDVVNRARNMGADLGRAGGTAGRAIHDPALKTSADRTRATLDSLVVELGANPLAWLRFRLF